MGLFSHMALDRRRFFKALIFFAANLFFLSGKSQSSDQEKKMYRAGLNTGARSKNAPALRAGQDHAGLEGGAENPVKTASVVRVRAAGVVASDFKPANYLDSIDSRKLDDAVAEGIRKISGEHDLKQAWLAILENFKPGDKIAIKPNFNFMNSGLTHTITSPQLINAVVKQLVEVVKVPPQNISIYDLCKEIRPDIVQERIPYPVQYVGMASQKTLMEKVKTRLHYGPSSSDTSAPIMMRERIIDGQGAPVTCYIPKVLTQAEHLINMPLLTNHIYVVNSGALKNHYGTVRFSNHNSYPAVLHGKVLAKSVTDINQNVHIKNKTRIIIADAIFGVFDRGEGTGKQPWKTFHDKFPESILISKDPVAIDSIMASFVARERKMRSLPVLSHDYLIDAAERGLGACEFLADNRPFSKIPYEEVSV
jgi:uncharacterized protein (DUF362 family)